LRVAAADDGEAFGLGGGADQGGGLGEDGVEVEVDGVEDDLPGLDLGEVEDVVDDAEQGVAGGVDAAGEPALGGVQVGGHEQVGESEDAVHGGADLVAHGGQEFAFDL
jgi:hypothetical protein